MKKKVLNICNNLCNKANIIIIAFYWHLVGNDLTKQRDFRAQVNTDYRWRGKQESYIKESKNKFEYVGMAYLFQALPGTLSFLIQCHVGWDLDYWDTNAIYVD